MTTGIDLSRSPYFDDFSANDNYYQILFRPAVAVQTRELNEMQSVLQDQIAKFGRNIFKDGSVVEGCSFSFDNKYAFVKIDDNYSNGTAFTISNFIGRYVRNINGLEAEIVNAVPGYQAQDPNTNVLYVKYKTSANFPNGAQQSVFTNSEQITLVTDSNVLLGNVTVFTPNTPNPNSVATGIGYAFTTSNGVIFKNGYFVEVETQTVIVDPYDNAPNGISVGFAAIENIITPEANSSLNDNAGGSPNYIAPGAHRFQIIPTLITMQTNNITNSTPFFSVCDFQSGFPISLNQDPQYNIIGAEIAQRTFETNGDYVVNPFVLTTEPKANTDAIHSTYNNLVAGRGLAYVKGYRNQFLNNVTVPIRKGTNYVNATSTITTLSYGNFINVNQYCGDFNNAGLVKVELHNVAKDAIGSTLFLGVSRSTTNIIGYTYLRGFEYNGGSIGTGKEQYAAYLMDIQMNAGHSFSEVMSLIYYNGSSVIAVADVVQVNGITQLTQPSLNSMIFPSGQKALKIDGFNNENFVYRKRANSSFSNLSSGVMTVSLPSPLGTATETFDFGGYLSVTAEGSFIVIPPAGGTSNNKVGSIAVTANASNVVGTTTSFLTDYFQGDFIEIDGNAFQINSIANSSFLTITTPCVTGASANIHYKVFPAGIPIDFTKPNRSIVVTSNVCTFTLGDALSGSFNASVYFDVLRSSTLPMTKIYNPHVYVAINCASHPANSVGPWSLGFADVYKINNIYVNEGSFSNTVPDSSVLFTFDNGQRDDHYELSSIASRSSFLDANSRILIDLDVFTYNQSQGVGFFNANSYPVDDANTANTTAIQTQYIPQYTSTYGTIYDLRDCFDFRPFANNVANSRANSSNWTTYATINPNGTLVFYVNPVYGSFLASPDTNYITDIQHYLGRIDKAVLQTSGALSILEGTPAPLPIPPIDSPKAMTLGIVTIPPYPTLSTPDAKAANRYDYAMTVDITQNKCYTMSDINAINNRVDALEYYTALNLLEQSIQSLLTRTANGQNTFQNGMLVDPFTGTDIADTLDPTFNCSITSNNHLMPAFYSFTKALWTNEDAILYSEGDYIFQNFESGTVNCTSSPLSYAGRIEFKPNLTHSPDFYHDPDVCNNLEPQSSWINIPCRPEQGHNDCRSPFSTTWGQWRHYDYPSGDIITNSDLVPYVKSRDICCYIRGLKPNTRVWGFCNHYDITFYHRQCQQGFADETCQPYGYPLISDEFGCLYTKFSIPPGIFKEGTMVHTFCDVEDIILYPFNITTRADGCYGTAFTDQEHWCNFDMDYCDSTDDANIHGMPVPIGGNACLHPPFGPDEDFYNKCNYVTVKLVKVIGYGENAHTVNTLIRLPEKSVPTPPFTNCWNPTYTRKDGFRSVIENCEVPRGNCRHNLEIGIV